MVVWESTLRLLDLEPPNKVSPSRISDPSEGDVLMVSTRVSVIGTPVSMVSTRVPMVSTSRTAFGGSVGRLKDLLFGDPTGTM